MSRVTYSLLDTTKKCPVHASDVMQPFAVMKHIFLSLACFFSFHFHNRSVAVTHENSLATYGQVQDTEPLSAGH